MPKFVSETSVRARTVQRTSNKCPDEYINYKGRHIDSVPVHSYNSAVQHACESCLNVHRHYCCYYWVVFMGSMSFCFTDANNGVIQSTEKLKLRYHIRWAVVIHVRTPSTPKTSCIMRMLPAYTAPALIHCACEIRSIGYR